MSIYRQGPRPANTCPRCAENLVVTPQRADVRYCEKCGGVFAGNAASEQIVTKVDRGLREIGFQAALGKPQRTPGEGTITCPECLVAMQKTRIDSAACFVDACPAHGTWFDTGELEQVMKAFTNARRKGVQLLGSQATPQAGAAETSGGGAEYLAGPGHMLRDLLLAAIKSATDSWWHGW